MKYVFACLTLVLAACGGGDNTAAPVPPPVKASRLVAFDAAGLDDGLNLPEFTEYWTRAEVRNGNSYPVKASLKDESVMALRISADGNFATRHDKWVVESLATIGRRVDELGKQFWNSELEASAAAIVLFADTRAPYARLLELCRELVSLQVRNLWLVTRDARDNAARLLPLFIDTDQKFREEYGLEPDVAATTLRVHANDAGFVGRDVRVPLSGDLGSLSAANRAQFRLEADARISDFAAAAESVAAVGFAQVEPFWPALDKRFEATDRLPVRDLAAYEDKLEITEGLDVPTLSEFWRAVATSDRLAPAASVDTSAPLLALRVNEVGAMSTRARGEPDWTSHQDDMEFLQALQRNAGEVDFDTGASTLQLLACVDRRASWETFLGVLEMMIVAGVHRLLVVTNDVIGPTLRLLDFSLPLGDLPKDATVATVDLQRSGIVADANYRLTFTHDGQTREYAGARYSSSLTIWAAERKSSPDVVVIRLPRDDPCETLFTVLNGIAWLGMKSVRIGG